MNSIEIRNSLKLTYCSFKISSFAIEWVSLTLDTRASRGRRVEMRVKMKLEKISKILGSKRSSLLAALPAQQTTLCFPLKAPLMLLFSKINFLANVIYYLCHICYLVAFFKIHTKPVAVASSTEQHHRRPTQQK